MDAAGYDDLGRSVWFNVGCLMVMFGLAWLSALRLASALRRPLVGVTVFNLVMGLSLLLVGLRDSLPHWIGYTLVNPLQIAAYVLIWRAGQALVGMPVSTREQALVVVLSCALTLYFGFPQVDATGLMTVAYGGNAWVALRGPWTMARRLQAIGLPGFALGTILCGLGIGLPMAARAIAGVVMAPEVDVDADLQASQAVAYACLVVVFGVNVLIAHYVFGRAVQDAERLASRDTLTGLDDRRTVEQALDYEWKHSRGRPLAVLTLAIDGMPALRHQCGDAVSDAVIAEVALLMRMHLRPGDVLGHAGGGRFLLLMPQTTTTDATRLARRMQRIVTHDGSLHPEGGHALTLSGGLAVAGDHGMPGNMLGQSERDCDRAQQAGGHRLFDRMSGQTWREESPTQAAAG